MVFLKVEIIVLRIFLKFATGIIIRQNGLARNRNVESSMKSCRKMKGWKALIGSNWQYQFAEIESFQIYLTFSK